MLHILSDSTFILWIYSDDRKTCTITTDFCFGQSPNIHIKETFKVYYVSERVFEPFFFGPVLVCIWYCHARHILNTDHSGENTRGHEGIKTMFYQMYSVKVKKSWFKRNLVHGWLWNYSIIWAHHDLYTPGLDENRVSSDFIYLFICLFYVPTDYNELWISSIVS